MNKKVIYSVMIGLLIIISITILFVKKDKFFSVINLESEEDTGQLNSYDPNPEENAGQLHPEDNTIIRSVNKTLSADQLNDRDALKSAITYLAVEDQNFNGAIKASDDYIKKYGDDLDVWVHRGMSYYQLHDCTNATYSIKKAVDMATSSEAMSVQDVSDLYNSMFTAPLSWCEK